MVRLSAEQDGRDGIKTHSGRIAALLTAVLVVDGLNQMRLAWRERNTALSRGSRRAQLAPAVPAPHTPRITVLVAAWECANEIERHVSSVLGLRYPNLEYVLCAGGADGTYLRARAYHDPRLTVIEQLPGDGKQGALRRGFARVTGEIVYFTDADCIVDDNALERTIAPIIRESEHVCTGASRPVDACGLGLLQYCRERYVASHAPPYSPGLLGRNCAVAAAALRTTHALDLPAVTGTDYRLARALLTAGYRIRFVAESEVRTDYPSGARAYARQQSRWLRNLYVHGIATRDWRHVRHAALTSLAGVSLLAGTFAAARSNAARVLWVFAVAHACIGRARHTWVGSSSAKARVPLSAYALLVPWVVLDALIWSAVPLQLVTRRERSRW